MQAPNTTASLNYPNTHRDDDYSLIDTFFFSFPFILFYKELSQDLIWVWTFYCWLGCFLLFPFSHCLSWLFHVTFVFTLSWLYLKCNTWWLKVLTKLQKYRFLNVLKCKHIRNLTDNIARVNQNQVYWQVGCHIHICHGVLVCNNIYSTRKSR